MHQKIVPQNLNMTMTDGENSRQHPLLNRNLKKFIKGLVSIYSETIFSHN
jgi:hypothetical protein